MGMAGFALRISRACGNAAATTKSRSLVASSVAYLAVSGPEAIRVSTTRSCSLDIAEPLQRVCERVDERLLIADQKAYPAGTP